MKANAQLTTLKSTSNVNMHLPQESWGKTTPEAKSHPSKQTKNKLLTIKKHVGNGVFTSLLPHVFSCLIFIVKQQVATWWFGFHPS